MLETLNILSDPDTMGALAEAEADLAAGDLTTLDTIRPLTRRGKDLTATPGPLAGPANHQAPRRPTPDRS